jgi:hypothetical protein
VTCAALTEDGQPFLQDTLLIGWHGESYVPGSLSSSKGLLEEVAEDTTFSTEHSHPQVILWYIAISSAARSMHDYKIV